MTVPSHPMDRLHHHHGRVRERHRDLAARIAANADQAITAPPAAASDTINPSNGLRDQPSEGGTA